MGSFPSSLTHYLNNLLGKDNATINGPVGFVGRVKTNQNARILSVTQTPNVIPLVPGNVVQLDGPIGAIANQSNVRFHRCYDVNGDPVKGSYLVSQIGVGNLYTLQGLTPTLVAVPSGTMRVDSVAMYDYQSLNVGQVVVKKIGRPSRGYRGRASAKTAA